MSEAIASPAGPPAHAGFLSKRSEWLRIWRKRYFKLYVGAGGPRLYYMKDAESPPHGMIDLRSCLTVKTADEKTGKQHSFEVATGEQVFFMCADTAAQKDEVRRAHGGSAGGRGGGASHWRPAPPVAPLLSLVSAPLSRTPFPHTPPTTPRLAAQWVGALGRAIVLGGKSTAAQAAEEEDDDYDDDEE